MADIKVMFSKKTDDWRTPSDIYNAFMNKGFIDPCPYQSKEDNLGKPYKCSKIFINPPFSKMSEWIDYGLELAKKGNKVVFLIPARTDTKYFHKLLECNPLIYFIEGRLHYNDSEKNAPFPSLLIVCSWYLGGYYSINVKNVKRLVEVVL